MESKGIIRGTFSYSQLNTFKTCPQQYKIIYLDGVRREHESIEAFMGKRVHGVLEWLYNHENMRKSYITFDRLCQAYDDQWTAEWHNHIYIADARKNSDFYYSIGKRCLSNYYNCYGPTFDQKVEDTEVRLKFTIGDYTFRGIIDRLDNPEPGKWVVHDYKTSKHPKSKRQAMNDIQLAMYQIAVEQNYEHVNEVSLTWHFLRIGSVVSICHTRDKLENIRKKLVRMVDKIIQCTDNENNFLPKETPLCYWCYLWEECTAKVGLNPVKRAD
tara:strand:- start:46 stop:858 length:813 start_codon:yes stop_codon:yes gene_type:complete